jgi:hypothetical protein
MSTLFSDLAYALRGLRKNLGFAIVATLTIALGVGACTAIFSVVNAVLLRPLPYAEAPRLVFVWGEMRARNVKDWPFAPPDYRDLKLQGTAVFEDVAGIIPAFRTPFSEDNSEPEQIQVSVATPNVFRVLGARVLVGRDFIEDDATPQPQAPAPAPGAPAAVPGPEAIFFADGYLGHGAASRWAVRSSGDPNLIAPAVRAAVREINPRAVLAEVQPMTAFVDKAMAPIRFTTTLIGVFAIVAVVMAAIGLYGVLATIVRQRTAEIGMRMVFGAPRASILGLIVSEGMKLSAGGIVIGAVAAVMVTRVMTSMLVSVSPTDPLTFVSIGLLFAAIAVAASWIPARRAARLDPIVALRED